MKRILVTGGAGFIGSNLCRYLLGGYTEVVCMDNFFSGQRRNIIQYLSDPNFSVWEWDITEPFHGYFDEIYNLACPASPVYYQRHPVETINACTVGMRNVLEIARRTGAKVLQASTSEVYGDPSVHPQREDYWGNVNPIGIRSCYDEGKRCAETMCMDYHREYGVDVKLARIFNTYGPNMRPDDGRVVSNFIVQVLKGKDITIYGDGRQTRSFQYVDDLIRGLLLLMSSNETGPINIGNPDEFTITELAEKIMKLTSRNSNIVYEKLPADDPQQRQPNIEVAEKTLGWKPMIPIDIGLVNTIGYFKSII